MSNDTPCPCGSGTTYSDCCAPYHQRRLTAPSPEKLMRSRYTAFCLHQVDYLIDTLHPAFRDGNDRQRIDNARDDHRWLALQILAQFATAPNQGTVEFVAYCQAHDRAEVTQLHERSQFVREAGRWFYTEGDQLPPLKLGRNDPCWCGSGKKLKKCHQGMTVC